METNDQPDIRSGEPAEIGRVLLILTEAGIKIELPDDGPVQDPNLTMHICEMGVAGMKQRAFAAYRQMKAMAGGNGIIKGDARILKNLKAREN